MDDSVSNSFQEAVGGVADSAKTLAGEVYDFGEGMTADALGAAFGAALAANKAVGDALEALAARLSSLVG